MSKAQYDIYLSKVLDLAKTLVIKSRASADSINASLMALGHAINDSDPSSWKYYLNLAGRYHVTDRLMTVKSLDTLQTIDFTRENLQEHRATYREYAYGSRYYNDLVTRYPEQEMLIRGILNPVDITTAINAPDGRILYHDPALVEDNETNLIPRLTTWTENFMVRWNVAAYGMVDDLYPAAQLAVLFHNLPSTILNIRLSNCHTLYAHSFHIREYLASNGRLDVYCDHLTKRQMLWLYRNIRYLHRNAGKRETFVTLVQHILTERGLPLAEWDMRHNIKDQLTEIYADIEFVRKPLNFGFSNAGADTRSVVDMLNEEQQVAKGNARIQNEAEIQITRQMENSITNKLSTKVLESSVLDLTDASAFTLSDCLLNHWLYLSAIEWYKSVVVVDNPKTGDALTLQMKDAFIVFLYCYNKARGLELNEIPLLEAINVRRVPTPSFAAQRKLASPELIPDSLIQQSRDILTPIGSYISTITFHEAMLKVHKNQLDHRTMWTSQEHMEGRVHAEMAISHLYCDIKCDLGAGTVYLDWFQDKGLDIPEFSELEADLLATQLLAAATGTNLKVSQSLKEMQGAMLRLMAQLSSYSIQFLQSINTQPVSIVDWPAVRIGDDTVKGGDSFSWDIIDVRVQDLDAAGHVYDKVDISELAPDMQEHVRLHHYEFHNPLPEFTDNRVDKAYYRLELAPVRILNVREPLDSIQQNVLERWTEDYVPVDFQGLGPAFRTLSSDMYALTEADRQYLRDRWQAWLDDHGTGKPPLDTALTLDVLPGFEYPATVDIKNVVLPGFANPYSIQTLDGIEYPENVEILVTDLDGFNNPISD